MPALADAVLPLIRTRADAWRWSVVNVHGSQMHDAVDLLEAATTTSDPAEDVAGQLVALGDLRQCMFGFDADVLVGRGHWRHGFILRSRSIAPG